MNQYLNINLPLLAEQCKALLIIASAKVRQMNDERLQGSANIKSDQSLVTEVDIAIEKYLFQQLIPLLPNSSMLAEEEHHLSELKGYTWILDPIDGTTNFVHSFPMYCISLALYRDNKPVMGFIQDIPYDRCFWAIEGLEGCYLDDKRLTTSNTKDLQTSILATGFPATAFDRLDEYMIHFKHLMQNTRGIRRLGSAALDLAYVAAGWCDGFFEYELKPWDVAAGAFLVMKAGGKVTDFNNGDNWLMGKQIIACNAGIHTELYGIFKDK
ncbi:MAG: inositol monophosphatase family protein [Bacteroidota bacterium]|nr:inositol monophosphatase family protein [Bacteroidota bacterium]